MIVLAHGIDWRRFRRVWFPVLFALSETCGDIASAVEFPIQRYDFDEGQGILVHDRSGGERHGWCVGDVEWVPSPWGWAVRLGEDGSIRFPRGDEWNQPRSLTFEAWVRWEGDPSSHQGKADSLGAVFGWRHGANGVLVGITNRAQGGRVLLVINGLRPPDGIRWASEASVSMGEWTYIAAVFDGETLRVQVNDQVTQRSIPRARIVPCPDPPVLGVEYPGSTYYRFRGAIDEVTITHRALSGSELLDHYRQGRRRAASPAKVPAVPAQPPPGGLHLVVAQDGSGDFNGTTEAPIVAALEAVKGGGSVTLRPGTYTVWHTISLTGARHLKIVGEDGARLQFPPLPHTVTVDTARPGDRELKVKEPGRFRPPVRVRVQAPGRTMVHAGEKRVIPTFDVMVVDRTDTSLLLANPLRYPVPAGTAVAFAENMMELRSGRDITIENLVFDGNRREDDPRFVGHTALCTFLAHGPYGYEEGLTGEPIRELRLRNCTFRNTHGRCIAWYAVVDSEIVGCVCEGTRDAGIDIDHFCARLRILDNRIRNCGIGVEINDGSYCQVEGNRIEQCARGIVIWRWCGQPDLNVENEIRGNIVLGSQSVAIHLQAQTERNRLIGNQVIGSSGDGIVVEGQRSQILKNTLRGVKGRPLVVTGEDNEVRDNSISPDGGGA